MSKDIERDFFRTEFYDILHSKSVFLDNIHISNEDLKLNAKPIIEYILSNIFPGITIAGGEYADKFSRALRLEHFRAEAQFCLENAVRVIQKSRVRLAKGTFVQFVDENPFLGGVNNAYGKLIMEKCCTDVVYTRENDLIYDIYVAGETLRTLYINFPTEISNYVYGKCKSYFDIINLPKVHPFTTFCSSRTCNIMIVDRTNFFKIYNDSEYDWIREELKNPDIFNRIFRLYRDNITASVLNDAKVATLRKYMIDLANKHKDNKDLFHRQIDAELNIYPYSDIVLSFADQVYRLVELGAINMEAAKAVFTSPVAVISAAEFSKQQPINVHRYMVLNSPDTKVFAFDHGTLGISIIRDLFTRFLGLNNIATIELLRNVLVYQQAEEVYGSVSKYIIRNKIATSTMGALSIWAKENRDRIQKYVDKNIIYDYQMNFLGASDNFLGKAFERVIKHAQAVSDISPAGSPVFRTPVYPAESPVFRTPTYPAESPKYISPRQSPYKSPLTPEYMKENPRIVVRSPIRHAEGQSPYKSPLTPEYMKENPRIAARSVKSYPIQARRSPYSPHRSSSPIKENIKLTREIRLWISETMENIRNVVEELSRISPETNTDFFEDVFFDQFYSLLNISKRDREAIAKSTGYEFLMRHTIEIEKMLLENNIVDLATMFNEPVAKSFERVQKQGREMLSRPITHNFFWETVSNLVQYAACITHVPHDDLYHFTMSMMLNVFGDKDYIEKYIKRFQGGVFDAKTTNRVNFWDTVVKTIDNPTNLTTLIVKIRKIIRYPVDNNPKAIVANFDRLINNYQGDKTVLLEILLDAKDYTTPYAVEYIVLRNKGKFKSLEDKAHTSGLIRFEEHAVSRARTIEDVKRTMTVYAYFTRDDMKTFLHKYEKRLRPILRDDKFQELQNYVANFE